jgi:hypothetical protein
VERLRQPALRSGAELHLPLRARELALRVDDRAYPALDAGQLFQLELIPRDLLPQREIRVQGFLRRGARMLGGGMAVEDMSMCRFLLVRLWTRARNAGA